MKAIPGNQVPPSLVPTLPSQQPRTQGWLVLWVDQSVSGPGKVITRNGPQSLTIVCGKMNNHFYLRNGHDPTSHYRRDTHTDHNHKRGHCVLSSCKAKYAKARPMWTVSYTWQQYYEGAWWAPVLTQGLSLSLLVLPLIVLSEWVMSAQVPAWAGLWIGYSPSTLSSGTHRARHFDISGQLHTWSTEPRVDLRCDFFNF